MNDEALQKREIGELAIGKLKGRATVEIETQRGNAEVTRCHFALLRPELHHYVTETVRPSGWYPESEHAELLCAGAKLYPGSPDRALEMMGEFAARTHCEIYKEILVGRGSPSRTFAMWATQHDTGELRRIRELPNRMRFELVGFGDTSREQCLVLTGYFRGTFSVNGFADVMVEKYACKLWGDESCIWRCSWNREEAQRGDG